MHARLAIDSNDYKCMISGVLNNYKNIDIFSFFPIIVLFFYLMCIHSANETETINLTFQGIEWQRKIQKTTTIAE